jgi:hypothetical protein
MRAGEYSPEDALKRVCDIVQMFCIVATTLMKLAFFDADFRCRIGGMIYGYARVSTAAQLDGRPRRTGQVRQLKGAGCEKVFREKITGTTADRPQLGKLIRSSRVAAPARLPGAAAGGWVSGVENCRAVDRACRGIVGPAEAPALAPILPRSEVFDI